MAVCNFCTKRETRARRFTLPFTCKECEENNQNYASTVNDITYVDASGKHVNINSETEINIIDDDKPIDKTNYKDALLASLYNQVELLRNQLEEKDLLIRTLIIQDGERQLNSNLRNNRTSTETSSDSGDSSCNEPVYDVSVNENEKENENENVFINIASPLFNNSETLEHNQDDEDIDFHDLYMQFVRDTEDEKSTQVHSTRTIETQTIETQINEDNDERFLWEKYSKGVASKIMGKMGYRGKA